MISVFSIYMQFVVSVPNYTYSGDRLIITGSGTVTKEGVRSVPYDIMVNCTINDGITTIGSFSFSHCNKLTSISLPNSLEKIEEGAFEYTGLTSLEIPKSVSSISFQKFIYYSRSIQKITVSEGNPHYSSFNGSIYTRDYSTLLQMPTATQYVEIHSSTTTLGSWSIFLISCPTLFIPKSVTTLDGSVFVDLVETNEIIFDNECEITEIPNNCFLNFYGGYIKCPPKCKTIGQSAFTSNEIRYFTYMQGSVLETVSDLAFNGCSKLENASFPSTLKSISPTAFAGCISLKNVFIDNSNRNFLFKESTIYTSNKKQIVFIYQNAEELIIYNETSIIPSSILQRVTTIKKITIEPGNKEFNEQDGVIYDYENKAALHATGSVSNVTFLETVEKISESLFNGIFTLTTAKFTSNTSLTRLETDCFRSTSITEMTIPNSVNYIGPNVFYNCTKLQSINIPSKAQYTGRAFCMKCTSLTTVTIPADSELTTLGEYSFRECCLLSSFDIPPNTTTIIRFALANIAVTELHMPDSLTVIQEGAFDNSKVETIIFKETSTISSILSTSFGTMVNLQTIYLPPSITRIEANAFVNCIDLMNIIWLGKPKLTELQSSVFKGCTSLQSFTIPDSVDAIEPTAFMGCTSLTDVRCSEAKFLKHNNALYDTKGETLLFFPPGLTTHSVKKSATTIAKNAFHSCSVLNTLSFENPSHVKSIGEETFYKCVGLTVLKFPASLERFDKGAFNGCANLKQISFPDNNNLSKIGSSTFVSCQKLNKVDFGHNSALSEIGESAFFQCANLESIVLPNRLHTIGPSAFEATAIASIIIPTSVASIGPRALADCSDLVDLRYCSMVKNNDETVVAGHNKNLRLYASLHFGSTLLFGKQCACVMKSCGLLPTVAFTQPNLESPSLLLATVIAELDDE